MAGNCSFCSPGKCTPHFLYVVFDPLRGACKIGMSRHAVRRYAQHRKKVGRHVELRLVTEAGCEWQTARKEREAIDEMAENHERLNGDWFTATPEDTIDVALAVLARGA